MPFPLLAHQAVILPLKMARPRWFDGSALVLGSVAPDVEYLRNSIDSRFTHSLLGALLCVPLTALVIYAGKKLGALQAVGARLGWRVSSVGSLAGLVVSATLGCMSHVMLDRLSRGGVAAALPATVFQRGALTISSGAAAQLGSTVVLSAVTLLCLLRMREQHRMDIDPRGRRVLGLATVVGILGGLLRARPALAHPSAFFESPQIFVWGFALFHVAAVVFVATLAAGFFLARRDAQSGRSSPLSSA